MSDATSHELGEEIPLQEVARLIDDLRHTEVSVRLNSIKKLPVISNALGAQRTRDELIPYLKGM